jgi:hypothetical protein
MTVYIVWAYDYYYPTGPGDVRGVFSSEAAAQQLVDCLSAANDHGKRYDRVEITQETVQ